MCVPVTIEARGEHLIEFVVLPRANGRTHAPPAPDFLGTD